MEKTTERTATEEKLLKTLCSMEDLAEKKANIYARLLIEPALAEDMEGLATRHEQRKRVIQKLLYGKPLSEKKNEETEK